jgi:hypothetical protein
MGRKRSSPDPEKRVNGLIADAKENAPAVLVRTGVMHEAEIKRLLLTPGRGRIYQEHKPGLTVSEASGQVRDAAELDPTVQQERNLALRIRAFI